MDIIKHKDTTELANYFQQHWNKYIRDTNVRFSDRTLTGRDEYYSKVARYVRFIQPDLFYRNGPDSTLIDNQLIARIRGLNLNVPTNFK
jgi:hypothetical protein